MSRDAFVAATRFGLGPVPGELAGVGSAPREWVLGQLLPGADDPRWGVVPSARVRVVQSAALLRGDEATKNQAKELARAAFANDVGVRAEILTDTARPFRARWELAWSNHFTVSVLRPSVASVAVPFERDAIAPNATGSFRALLGAATLHPAMLMYLDNIRSIGPNSPVGRRRDKGLNENLARELLELHTLGVDGGYVQADVEALACILTGWSLAPEDGDSGAAFRPELHEPGAKTLLGTKIPEGGADEIHAALDLLARHPSTARNVATRLARHFVADDPPEKSVRAIERAFGVSDGDLVSVAEALVVCDAAWSDPLSKLRTPHDLVTAVSRGLGPFRGEQQIGVLRALGQIPFTAPSPAGWSDRAEDWAGSDQVLARVDFAERLAAKVRTDPVERSEALLGPVLSPATRRAVASADRERGTALLLASPEFQRR